MVDEYLKNVSAGEYLLKEGEESTELYYVKSGKLEVIINDEVVDEIGVNEVVGEMSFLDEKERSATVRAIEDSELLTIPRQKILEFEKSLPDWYKKLVTTLVMRLRKANKMPII